MTTHTHKKDLVSVIGQLNDQDLHTPVPQPPDLEIPMKKTKKSNKKTSVYSTKPCVLVSSHLTNKDFSYPIDTSEIDPCALQPNIFSKQHQNLPTTNASKSLEEKFVNESSYPGHPPRKTSRKNKYQVLRRATIIDSTPRHPKQTTFQLSSPEISIINQENQGPLFKKVSDLILEGLELELEEENTQAKPTEL